MKFGIKFRVIALSLVVAMMGIFILLATLRSQRQAIELRDRLAQVESESFQIADEFRDSLRELNNTMQRYGLARDPALLKEFVEASHKLDLWIDDQKPKLTTQREKDAMEKIDQAYDGYMAVARKLQVKLQASTDTPASLADFEPLRDQSKRLFDFGQTLSKAHYESRNAILAQASQSITQLRWLILSSLGLLFVFGLGLAGVVYRDMIAPLRVKLVESQTLIDRQEKLASLGMLAAGVAHEIRNPLTAIRAALFLQQRKLPPNSQDFADSKLVEREILRLERIVNNFLQFARPSEPELAVVSAELPLQETQDFLGPVLARSNINVVVEKSPQLQIKADPAQIKQVLINLVQNAADSIVHDGTITLRARHSRKHLSNSERDVVILEVQDTGRGMTPEVEKRLFDPFFTTKEAGTGLGLPIASGIVRNHGGQLQYQTQVDHGTTFGIILPEVTA